MEAQSGQLSQLFLATTDAEQMKQAEQQLEQASQQADFMRVLVYYLHSSSQLGPVRVVSDAAVHAGILFFKNIVKKRYPDTAAAKDVAGGRLSDTDRGLICNALPELLLGYSQVDTYRKHILSAWYEVVKEDYKPNTEYAGLLWTHISSFLQSPEESHVLCGMLVIQQVAQANRYEDKSSRGDFSTRLSQICVFYVNLIHKKCSPDQLKTIFKTIFRICSYRPVDYFTKSIENTLGWINNAVAFIFANYPVVSDLQCSKAAKWAARWVDKMYSRYGRPSATYTDDKVYSKQFIKQCGMPLTQLALNHLSMSITSSTENINIVNIDQLLQTEIDKTKVKFFMVLKQASAGRKVKALLVEHAGTLVSKVIFPLLCYNTSQQELWEASPLEFVHQRMSEYTYVLDTVDLAAISLTSKLARTSPDFLSVILRFCSEYIQGYIQTKAQNGAQNGAQTDVQTDGILNLLGAVGQQIGKRADLRSSVESIFSSFILPQFSSPTGFIRARACEITQKLFFFIKVESSLVIGNTVQCVCQAMQDPEIIVRALAFNALKSLVAYAEFIDLLRPHLKPILESLIQLSAELEQHTLMEDVFTKLVLKFDNEVYPIIHEISHVLVLKFVQINSEIIRETHSIGVGGTSGGGYRANNSQYTDDPSLETSKHSTANGFLHALEILTASFMPQVDVIIKLVPIIVPALDIGFSTESSNFYHEKLFSILCNILFGLEVAHESNPSTPGTASGPVGVAPIEDLPSSLWGLFPKLYVLYKTGAIGYFTDITAILKAYITWSKKSAARENPMILAWMVDIFQTEIFKNDPKGRSFLLPYLFNPHLDALNIEFNKKCEPITNMTNLSPMGDLGTFANLMFPNNQLPNPAMTYELLDENGLPSKNSNGTAAATGLPGANFDTSREVSGLDTITDEDFDDNFSMMYMEREQEDILSLIECALLHYDTHTCQFVLPRMVEIVLYQLFVRPVLSTRYKALAVEVLLSAIYAHPVTTLAMLERVKVSKDYFDLLLSHQKDLTRVHDLNLIIFACLKIVSLPVDHIPQSIRDPAFFTGSLLPLVLASFEKLPEAVNIRRKEEEDEEAEDEAYDEADEDGSNGMGYGDYGYLAGAYSDDNEENEDDHPATPSIQSTNSPNNINSISIDDLEDDDDLDDSDYNDSDYDEDLEECDRIDDSIFDIIDPYIAFRNLVNDASNQSLSQLLQMAPENLQKMAHQVIDQSHIREKLASHVRFNE